jgi:uncharacterized protein
MNGVQLPRTRQNNPAELRAFERVCESLGGFDDGISFEWVDGFLAALACGQRVPPQAQWLQALAGDAFGRAFADPADCAQASRALQARLSVLCDQLDPQVLMDQPDELRLDPLMAEWTDEDRARVAQEDGVSAEEAAALQTGAQWSEGFFDAVEAFPVLWDEPEDEEAAATLATLLDQIAALLPAPSDEEFLAHVRQYYPQGNPTRDELLAEACFAAQGLRVFWCDHAAKPATRRVEPVPGRNDACPCGSGRKYKKCHGAGAQAA